MKVLKINFVLALWSIDYRPTILLLTPSISVGFHTCTALQFATDNNIIHFKPNNLTGVIAHDIDSAHSAHLSVPRHASSFRLCTHARPFCHKKPAATPAPAATDPYTEVQPATETIDLAMYQRIRDEGLNHSHVMDFGYALMDGIGPRLTGSPNARESQRVDPRHAHKDRPGECSSLKIGASSVSAGNSSIPWARMVTPDTAILIVQATPWSPSTTGAVTGDVVFVCY